MTRMRLFSIAAALLVAAGASAQDKPAPPRGFDADACAKHCQEMAAQRQKMMDTRKAMADKTAAAWKEIRASVDEAKKARGEKKVAALETALDRLVAFHEQMMGGKPGMPGMGGMPGMACCGGGMGAGHRMMHGGPGGMAGCCGGDMHAMGDCCSGMPDDCPMMKKGE